MNSKLKSIRDDFTKNAIKHLPQEFYYEIETSADRPAEYYINFKRQLLDHPNYDEIKHSYILDDNSRTFVRIISRIPITEMEDIEKEFWDFYPICSKDEIRRIADPQNTFDYLLQFRAESVLTNARLKRVFSQLRAKDTVNWDFSDFFSADLFYSYLEDLPDGLRKECEQTAYGFANINSANGFLMECPAGNIVIISGGLKHFLYYMNLYFYGELYGFRDDAKLQSLILAVRTMIGRETFDFELDPRSDLLPDEIHEPISDMTNTQLKFVIGHEFAHHYLGHLSHSVSMAPVIASSRLTTSSKFHSYQHQHEFEADYQSIKSLDVTTLEREQLGAAAINFFLYLEIYNAFHDYISPPNGSPSSHPDPFERIQSLLTRLPELFEETHDEILTSMESIMSLKNLLVEKYLPFNVEEIEQYGSVYLNSYRKTVKHDHIDF